MAKKILAVVAMLWLASAAGAEDASPPFGLNPHGQSSTALASPISATETVTIPAETEAAVLLLSGIHTQVSHVDDPIKAQLLQPVYVNGRVALPRGTLLDGRITRIRSAGRLRRPAELAFRFERILLPDGQAQPIGAALAAFDDAAPPKARLDAEGYLKGTRGFPWKGLAGGLVGLGGIATLQAKIAGAAAWGPFLPLGGSLLAGYAVLWSRGNDIHVPPETRLRIRLNQPVTVRVAS